MLVGMEPVKPKSFSTSDVQVVLPRQALYTVLSLRSFGFVWARAALVKHAAQSTHATRISDRAIPAVYKLLRKSKGW